MIKKWNATDVCDLLYNEGYRFISGKWFKDSVEIKEFEKQLYKIKDIRALLRTNKDAESIRDTFISMYSEIGKWPELPIIKEAKEQAELKPLCFPLNEKQLILINRLINGIDEKFYILTGVGGSGKSTFANIIKQIFENDVASLTLEDLGNDFKLATGINKRLIYADELNSDDLNNGIIKTIASKQAITVNPKYAHSYDAVFQGGLLFSCNKPPKLDLSDTGIIRRICYYSMNKKIEHPDLSLQKKEWTHEDLVNIVAHALKVNTNNWEKLFEKETREILRANNSVWLCKGKDSLETTPYETYKNIATSKGLRAFSEPRFEEVKALLLEWEKEETAPEWLLEEEGINYDDLPF